MLTFINAAHQHYFLGKENVFLVIIENLELKRKSLKGFLIIKQTQYLILYFILTKMAERERERDRLETENTIRPISFNQF